MRTCSASPGAPASEHVLIEYYFRIDLSSINARARFVLAGPNDDAAVWQNVAQRVHYGYGFAGLQR